MTNTEFLQRIEAFLVRHNMSATAFGVQSSNDSAFVFRMRKNRNATLDKVNEVLAWMDKYERNHKETAA